MTASERRESQFTDPLEAYKNGNVEQSITASHWYTPEYIVEVKDHEPEPPSVSLGPFKDSFLGDFFNAEMNLDKGTEIYQGARLYIFQRLISPDGHPYRLNRTKLFDDELSKLARSLGTADNHEFDRAMLGQVSIPLMAMIAPEHIRRPVIKATHPWGSDRSKQDVLLWSQLVKKGALAYLQRENPNEHVSL
jgi:hypothetical protein